MSESKQSELIACAWMMAASIGNHLDAPRIYIEIAWFLFGIAIIGAILAAITRKKP
jgi:hypothetical protein